MTDELRDLKKALVENGFEEKRLAKAFLVTDIFLWREKEDTLSLENTAWMEIAKDFLNLTN